MVKFEKQLLYNRVGTTLRSLSLSLSPFQVLSLASPCLFPVLIHSPL